MMKRKRRAAMIAAVLSAAAFLGVTAGNHAAAPLNESLKWNNIELK